MLTNPSEANRNDVIVIDSGSYQTKVSTAAVQVPAVFRTVVGYPRQWQENPHLASSETG